MQRSRATPAAPADRGAPRHRRPLLPARTSDQSTTRLLILGYGAFGRAFHAALSSRRDLAVSVYSRSRKTYDHPVMEVYEEARTIPLDEFDVIVVALPSGAVGDVLGAGQPGLPQRVAFVSCVKGMDAGSARFPSEVIYTATHSSFIAVISGASFADEMLARRPVFLTFACANLALGRDLISQLENPMLHFQLIDDVRGLEVAGVGKNIIALGAGLADGLELGENFRASFIARGVVELRSVAQQLGGSPETIVSPGALADFFLTCSSPKSRNYMHGRRLAVGDRHPSGLVEGWESARSFVTMLREHRIGSSYFEAILASLDDPDRLPTILEIEKGS